MQGKTVLVKALDGFALLHYFNDLLSLFLCNFLLAVGLPCIGQRAEFVTLNGYHKMLPCPLKGVFS